MELLLLRAYAAGYRGCVIDESGYVFFQCRRNGSVKRLKHYSKTEFADTSQFMAMMQKFVSPPIFLQPPVPIRDLTFSELDRVYNSMQP